LLGKQQIGLIAGWRLIQSQPVQGIFPDFHLDGDVAMPRCGRGVTFPQHGRLPACLICIMAQRFHLLLLTLALGFGWAGWAVAEASDSSSRPLRSRVTAGA
jgi:hypothetical protein